MQSKLIVFSLQRLVYKIAFWAHNFHDTPACGCAPQRGDMANGTYKLYHTGAAFSATLHWPAWTIELTPILH